MTLIHDTFTLDRTYDATVPEVWRAWTDPEMRARWFKAPDGWQLLERSYELKPGGREVLRGRMPSGIETHFSSRFHVVVPDRHIVSAYDMHVGGTLISVSLATLDLEATGKATRLRYTEQGVYLDGKPESPGSRQIGTSWHLDNFGKLFGA